jgi:hypothetical protein
MEDLNKQNEKLWAMLKDIESRLARLESGSKDLKSASSQQQQSASQTKLVGETTQTKSTAKVDTRMPEGGDSVQFAMLEKYLKHMLNVLPTP